MSAESDATEAATPRRLQKAREDGNVPLSREVVVLAGTAAGLAALALQARLEMASATAWLGGALNPGTHDPAHALTNAFHAVFVATVPTAAAVLSGAGMATLLQTGFLLRPAALVPDIARISPAAGLRKLFGSETLVQALRAMIKLAAFSAIIWLALPGLASGLYGLSWATSGAIGRTLAAGIARLGLTLLGVQAAVALIDLAWSRFQHGRKLRMTRQQVRDDHRESEGNPQVKQRRLQIARSGARRRMMSAVPKAAVVITNPEHYAVALAYERGTAGAPRMVAKGVDEMAARIRELARSHRIPLVANPPLARALYRVELDTEIPAEHFRAVAEIVAYVWRLGARRPPL